MDERNPSKLIREFSKETGQDARSEKAQEILAARKLEREQKDTLGELRQRLEQVRSKESIIKEKELLELGKRIEESSKSIEKMRSGWFSKLKNWKEISQKKNEIEQLLTEQVQKEGTAQTLADEAASFELNIAELQAIAAEQKKPADTLKDFYDQEQERWAKTEISWEDVDKYFSAERLKELSLPEYVELLQRFPQEVVTHVSRRGVRDHADLVDHTSGMFETSDGFDKVLESKHLVAGMSARLEQQGAENYIGDHLNLDQIATKEEALKKLEREARSTGVGSTSDHSAVHFATEYVADQYYGAESGNENFVVFASALIASEYKFGGYQHGDIVNTASSTIHNDVWVWAKEEQGIPIDAGIVFLPKDAQVDAKTGSRYAIDSDNKPVVAKDRINTFDKALLNPQVVEMLVSANEQTKKMKKDIGEEVYSAMQRYDATEIERRSQTAIASLREEVYKRMESEFALSDESVKKLLFDHGADVARLMPKSGDIDGDDGWSYREQRNLKIQEAKAYLETPTSTVTSEEYWNAYFKQHPDRKPSKIVYYEGGNPKEALKKWKEENGLTKKSKDTPVNLNERSIVEPVFEENGPAQRYLSLGRDVIEKHFAEQEPASNAA